MLNLVQQQLFVVDQSLYSLNMKFILRLVSQMLAVLNP